MRIIILGPPGSGKSTQGKLLAKHLGVPFISMGQVLRDAKEARTILGLEASMYVEKGELVPSRMMEALTRFRLEEDDTENGFVLDGSPRKVEEAIILSAYLEKKDAKIDRVFLIRISDKEAIKRLLKRYTLPKEEGGKRSDDNLADIKVRLTEFYENINPLKIYYADKDKLEVIDGDQSIKNIQKEIRNKLKI